MTDTTFPTAGDRPGSRALLATLYVLLAVLFLRTIWGMWDVRDITSGDTSSYYITALEFSQKLVCNIAWSPLYTSFLGSLHWLSPDPYFVIIAHRILILAAITVLLFEVSRRLLEPVIAWFITAWWLALPINFNALYEVHLFAVIPVLIFWLLLAWRPSLWVRGICVGWLVLTVFLVRNEMLIGLGMFGAASVAFDLWQIWRREVDFRPLRYLTAYGVPIIVACGIIGITYWRSTDKFPELNETLSSKHTLNVSQIYTFGYSQRHPEYTDSPWTDYQALMIRDFGKPLLTMKEAIKANPKAMFEHFWWNAQLIPSGLQVSLFDCRSGDFNPDYADTVVNKPVAITLSLLYLAIVAAGIVLVVRNFKYWWREWLPRRAWVIVGIISVCATVAVVMIMQRPRPSYMFTQTLALMWLGGFSFQIILFHFRPAFFWRKPALVLALATALLIPRFYVQASQEPTKPSAGESGAQKKKKLRQTRRSHARPLLETLRLLQPYRDLLASGKTRAGAGGYPFELESYLDLQNVPKPERLVDTAPLLAALGESDSFDAAVRSHGIGILVIPFYQAKKPKVREFMDNAPALGWRLVKGPANEAEPYWLYVAEGTDSLVNPPASP